MKHRRFIVTLVVTLLAFILVVGAAGCGGTTTSETTQATAATSTSGATETSGTTATSGPAPTTATTAATTPAGDQPVLRIGFVGGAFPSLNPFVGGGFAARLAWQVMYGSLVGFDATAQEYKPELADSWTVSPDGLTYTFKMHAGAVWSDGKPITSKDAAFTYNTMVSGLESGATGMWGPNVGMLAKVEAPDDATLVITLAGPSPGSLVLSNISEIPILPQQFWGPLAAGDASGLKTATMDPTKETMVVSGPFTIAKLDLQGTTLFKRVDTFYGEKPLITGWGAVSLTNVDAAIQALKSGELDLLADIPQSAAGALSSVATLTTKGIGTSPCFIAANYSKNYTVHPELTNVKVREAMNLAIDRATICKVAYRDFATPGGFILVPPYAPKFISAAAPVPAFDTAKANSLLDGLGFAKGSDGIRVANGVKMDYTFLVDTPSSALAGDIFGVLKENFTAIGINLTEKVLDDPYTASFAGEKAYTAFDMIYMTVGMYPDPERLLAYGSTRGLARFNFTGYSNPAYDELFKQEGVTVDPAARKAILDKIVALLQQDQVYIGIADFQNIAAWDSKWQNISDLSGPSDMFDIRNNWSFNKLAKQQ